MTSKTQTFNISFPRELVEQIDDIARKQFGSRSDFLRTAALEYIRKEKLWQYIFEEGQKYGAQSKQLTYEEVAELVTESRRARRQAAK